MNTRISSRAYLALLIVYLVWGTTIGAMHIGIESFPTLMLPCLRFLLAGSLLTGFCLLKGERLPAPGALKEHAIIGLLLFVGGNSIVCWSIKHITTGLGGLLVGTTPFWMIWLSSVLPPREKIEPVAMLGIGIGFIGMAILLSPQLSHWGSTTPLFWLSVLVMSLNVFCWSLGSIYARKHPTPDSLLMSVGLQNLLAGLMLIPVALITVHDWNAVHPTASSWGALAYLVLMGTMAATPCYLYVLQTLPVSVSSTFAYVTPVLTVFFGWLFLHESVPSTTWIGAAVILSGVLVVQWVAQRRAAVSSASPVDQTTLKEAAALWVPSLFVLSNPVIIPNWKTWCWIR
jgi:drug/metabolite transporter (DMT)-like permease